MKIFLVNPKCCDNNSVNSKYNGLRFLNGITVTMKNGQQCTCDENGGCEGMMPPTCTEGDTKCEVRTLYECVGGVWVKEQTFPCPNCEYKEICGEELSDVWINPTHKPSFCCPSI